MAPLEASGSWLYINFRFSENLEQSSMRYLRLKIRDHIRRICETKVVKSSSSCEHTKIAIVFSNLHQFGTSKQMLFNVRIEKHFFQIFLSHYPCSRAYISATKRARDLRMAPFEASGSWLYINFRFSEILEQSSMRYLRLKIRDHTRLKRLNFKHFLLILPIICLIFNKISQFF